MIAINVALIPEDGVVDTAIRLNRGLTGDESDLLTLGKEKTVPHITLLQGFVHKEDLKEVLSKVENLTYQGNPNLTLTDTRKGEMSGMNWLLVENTPSLQKLHEDTLSSLKPLVSWKNGDKNSFVEPVDDRTVQWAKGFPTASKSEYIPHISIGFGDLPEVELPTDCQISRVGIFQMGQFCSCHTQLHSVSFAKQNS